MLPSTLIPVTLEKQTTRKKNQAEQPNLTAVRSQHDMLQTIISLVAHDGAYDGHCLDFRRGGSLNYLLATLKRAHKIAFSARNKIRIA